jgi:hypothetical protein
MKSITAVFPKPCGPAKTKPPKEALISALSARI